jgi:hypothetical protein
MGRRSLAAKLGVSQRRRDNDRPEVPTAPGALGMPAVRVGKPARPRAARLVRTLRTRWWPRFLLSGVLLVVVGVTLLSGAAKAWVVGAGAAIIFVIGLRFHSPLRGAAVVDENWVPPAVGGVRVGGGWGLALVLAVVDGVEGAQLCWCAAGRQCERLDRSRPRLRLLLEPRAG